MTWLTPAIIVLSESGSSTLKSVCQGRPEGVRRLDGVPGYLLDAEHGEPDGGRHREDDGRDQGRPGADPQKDDDGHEVYEGRHRLGDVEYGPDGGLDRVDLAAIMPIGMPIASATTVAARTSARVCIAASQRSRLITNSNPSTVKSATLQPASRSAITPRMATMTSAGGERRTNSSVPMTISITESRRSKAPSKVSVIHSTPLSVHSASGILGTTSAARERASPTPPPGARAPDRRSRWYHTAEALALFTVRLDARGQPGDERAADDDALETATFADDGHRRAPVLHEERQDLAQRGSPPDARGVLHRGVQLALVALDQLGDLLRLGDADQAPLFVHHEDVREAGLPHAPQDHRRALAGVRDLLGIDHHALGVAHLGVVHALDKALHVLVGGLRQDLLRGADLDDVPSFMIATRCPSVSASSRSWVTKTTVRSPRPGCPERGSACLAE